MSVEKARKYASIRHRKSIFDVEIEEVDESWALKLLNECEQEDNPITVQNTSHENPFCQTDICLIGENEPSAPNDPPEDPESIVVDAFDETPAASLSAIEYQVMAMAKRVKAENDGNSDKPAKPRSSLERLKAFFVV